MREESGGEEERAGAPRMALRRPKKFYRGLGPTIIGYLPTWAIYFTVYDKVKVKMGALRGESLCYWVCWLRAGTDRQQQQATGQDDTISLDL